MADSDLYLVPINDSFTTEIRYLGSDIIITPQNEQIAKIAEIIRQKPLLTTQ
jgi:hypothetical protein